MPPAVLDGLVLVDGVVVLDHLYVGLLVLARVLAMLQVAPLFSSAAFPQVGKVGLALFLTIIVLPWVVERGYPLPASGVQYALLLAGEVLVGLLLGFLVYLAVAAFQVAGQFLSLQLGFGAADVFDPFSRSQIPALGQLFYLLALLVFLGVGGVHRFMLTGVLGSFQALRAGDLANPALLATFSRSLGGLFATALTIAFPVFGSLLLVTLALALLAKAAPHMNLLILGLPISIGAGLVILLIAMPLLLEGVAVVIDSAFLELRRLLVAVAGGRTGGLTGGGAAGLPPAGRPALDGGAR